MESEKMNNIINSEKEEEEESEEEEEKEEEIESDEDENEKKKCSLKEHSEIDAIIYCLECKIYMCNKCKDHHSQLFQNHHIYSLDKKENNKDKNIFTGLCKEKNHSMALDYFCKNHNQLCCAACLCKIKAKGSGKHADCDVCYIKKIEKKKKKKLNNNIKYLEDLSFQLEYSINELKTIFEKINDNRVQLRIEIQKIFTIIRNTVNEREDQLLSEVDKQFDILFFQKDLVDEGEKLPKKVKNSIEKGKLINNEWKDENKLNSNINDCINIENNIKNINEIKDSINKCNLITDLEIKFSPEQIKINQFLDTIKSFGKIYYINFKFKNCPTDIDENKKYEVVGDKRNIITKVGASGYWTGVICDNELQKSKIYKWKINLLKSYSKCNYFKIGVAPMDFKVGISSYNYGWYIDCSNSCLYSGPPNNYDGKLTFMNRIKNEIIVIMDMNKGSLKFIIDNEDNEESYTDIPLDKPLAPAVFLYYQNDSIEINEY